MGSKPTEFLEAAASEYEAALDWYFERSPVAAARFDAEVNRALRTSQKTPKDGPHTQWNSQIFPAPLPLHCHLSGTAIYHSNSCHCPWPSSAWLLEA